MWLCAPAWDSDTVFAALIGGAGHCSVTPRRTRRAGRLLRERHPDLAQPLDHHRRHRRMPRSPRPPRRPAPRVLLRRILAVDGDARLDVRLHAAAGFGAHHRATRTGTTPGAGPPGPAACTCAGPAPPAPDRPAPGTRCSAPPYAWTPTRITT
ncbi:hypothetical protein [Kitasatospora sp. NPDC085879]|uniref:hypothetical protein n=1 Tax=Kitasatospora sp. NPDC085879 TaxID=3154769 RepID=UPI0034150332